MVNGTQRGKQENLPDEAEAVLTRAGDSENAL